MALIRLVVFGLIGLTVIYLAMAWFARSTCRERLEKEWDAENPGGDAEARAKEVEQGVEAFRSSLVYRSLMLIYAVPTLLVIAAYFTTN